MRFYEKVYLEFLLTSFNINYELNFNIKNYVENETLICLKWILFFVKFYSRFLSVELNNFGVKSVDEKFVFVHNIWFMLNQTL